MFGGFAELERMKGEKIHYVVTKSKNVLQYKCFSNC